MNQELFNRINYAAQNVINQYLFEPVSEDVVNSIAIRISAHLSRIQASKDITKFNVTVAVSPDGNTISTNIEYKEPNLANTVVVNLAMQPSLSKEDRFDRAMKGI